MKIILAGGSGQVGTILARAFRQAGHSVVVLSRTPTPWPVVAWPGKSLGSWTEHLKGVDAVINLVGRSVNCRYDTKHRREIMESRVDSALVIGKAIAKCSQPPRVWLQANTAPSTSTDSTRPTMN